MTHPLAGEPFDSIFRGAKDIAVILPDKTRNCGAPIFLPILLRRLRKLGIRESKIKIILATGTHAAHTQEQKETIAGKEIAQRFQIIEHDCRHSEDLVFLGETRFATPAFINRNVVEADKVLVAGSAVHHYFAGFGGGPKMINPGCAGYETITKNHALSIDPESGWLHPNCRAGVMTDNPVQMDIADSMRFVTLDFLFETVLNDSGEVVAVAAGECESAHRQACGWVDEFYKVNIDEMADLVIVSAGGYPKDINFIQSHKSLHNAFCAVKEGGVILAFAECREGIGSDTFLEWFDYRDEGQFLENLKRQYKVNGTTALALKMKTRAVSIILVSTLPGELVVKLGMIPATTVDDGWRLAQVRLPQNFKCYVIPNGSLTLPQLN